MTYWTHHHINIQEKMSITTTATKHQHQKLKISNYKRISITPLAHQSKLRRWIPDHSHCHITYSILVFQAPKTSFEPLRFQTIQPKYPELQKYTEKSWCRWFRGWFRNDAHRVPVTLTKLSIHGIMRTLWKAYQVHIL